MTDQHTLLADYAANASDQSFCEIVHRFIDLVYSTALRLVNGDTHRAEDVTQTVFADLARLAGSFSKNVSLGGWLHRRTYHVATTIMRNERRRLNRERRACEMNSLHNEAEAGFEQIAPYLDEAINGLNHRDREAIMLRFFEHHDLRTIGNRLGTNEDAAQKCVSRAVEKLRLHFARRGIAVSCFLITSVLAANAVQAAPVGLALAVASSSLSAAANVGAGGFIATLTKTMLMKKTTSIITLAVCTAIIITSAGIIQFARASGSVDEKTLDKGLILHMTFDQDEAASQIITDISGKGNNGRASGVRWTPNGKNGGAYQFAADGDQILVPNNKLLNLGQFTLSAWVNTTTGDHFWRRIFDKGYNKSFALSVAGDWQGRQWYGQACLEVGPGNHAAITKNRVDDGRWHHLVATFDGANQLVYVDGQIRGKLHWKGPANAGASDADLVIGCNRSNIENTEDDLGVSFRGFIDEPMVWDRALSEEEIAFLYRSQNGLAGKPSANHSDRAQ